MKDIKFDTKKVIANIGAAKYNVKYYLFFSKDKVGSITPEEVRELDHIYSDKSACFFSFMRLRQEFNAKYKKYPNRILFVLDFKKHSIKDTHLSETEIEEWMVICKEHKLIPKYIYKDFKETGFFDVDMTKISKEKLYVYLSSVRYIQDEPFFVRAILHMVNDLKLGFFTSFAVATKFCANNSGHHLLNYSKDYALGHRADSINDTTLAGSFRMDAVSQLAQFLNGKDKGPNLGSYTGFTNFRLHQILGSIKLKGNIFNVFREDLLDKRLEEAIVKGNFKKLTKTKASE
jgi:hypothetical protein